ncbi:ABC-F family ATP-binding cassette domain-containing protein [Brevibacterium sp. BRM-1]|uniref:ABC-F family ATP-binding cassette domain-containing protein n=1 Tax=Brevibacterium sp. BRM-1 TaxID=2999062 RepID=UPI00228024A6|nr:ABC-F family ATP-binding cassette domain-containing protein [Brevibacterium sp. BRM-1]WAL40190.1 ABC-F family ATP-binding cassette domain-containing protein [Brevibacterium sp. BRM-1]
MHLLGAESIGLSYPNRTVLDGVTLGVSAGDRIGIVGRNGDGKSTLMRILSGDIEPDAGRVTARGGTTIGYLRQTDDLPADSTVRSAVVGDVPDHEWASRAHVRDVVSGLLTGTGIDLDARIGDLSGGQRRRTALARLLAGDWGILALDEPTNHLDMTGVRWLAEHIKRRWPAGQGALLVVTHDRWFLDEVSTLTWEVHDAAVDAFEGGYAAYVLQRVERDRQAQAVEAKRQNLMRKELAWLRRGAPARTSKPKFRIDAANALISGEPPVRDTVELVSMATSRLGKDVFELVGAAAAYADAQPVIEPTDWIVGPGDRIGLLGANGAGKSTLINLLTGRLEPSAGRVKRGKTVRTAILDQQLRDLSDIAEDRIRELLARRATEVSTAAGQLTPTQLLERLGLGDVLQSRVKDLSGGQARRLQLLLVLLDEPNVLILDEPTNDMDTDMLAAMEDLLDTWPGTLLVISHDRYFVERVTDDQYAVLGHRLRHLPGGVDEYLRLAAAQEAAGAARPGRASGAGDGTVPGTGTSAGQASAAEARAGEPGLSSAERRRLDKEAKAIARRIDRAEDELAKLDARLAAHDQSDFAGLAALTQERGALAAEKDDLELEWLDLSERLED